MSRLVVDGAKLKCSEGLAPSTLTVPSSIAEASPQRVATVMDYQPTTNVAAFGMCKTQANPRVASATAAAQGTPTPMPYMPVITSPWSPGASVVTIGDHRALTSDSTCSCTWSGKIEITSPGSDVEVD